MVKLYTGFGKMDKKQYTERDYRKILLRHLLVCLLMSVGFVLGKFFSGSERGENKTSYFLTAMVSCGINVLGALFCLYIITNTRNPQIFVKKDAAINKALGWYSLLTFATYVWSFFAVPITLVNGCCKGEQCYVQTNQEINITIAVYIGVLHIISWVWFMILNSKARVLHFSPPKTAETKTSKCTKIGSDSSEENETTDNQTISVPEKQQKNSCTKNLGVWFKACVLFKHSKNVSKEVAPEQIKIATISKDDKPNSDNGAKKRGYIQSESGPVDFLVTPQTSQRSLTFDSVITHDENKRVTNTVETERRNPYYLSPLPDETRHYPENLYNESTYPDTTPLLALPDRHNVALKSRNSLFK